MDPGFPVGGGVNVPGWRHQHTNFPDFPKNCIKLRKFWSMGGGGGVACCSRFNKPSRCGRVVSASHCKRGLQFKSSILPLLKHAPGESDRPLCWPYTLAKGVTPEVNLRECISCTPPTLVLKPRGDVTRSPKQGYQWPQKSQAPYTYKQSRLCQKWTCRTKIIKKRSKFNVFAIRR